MKMGLFEAGYSINWYDVNTIGIVIRRIGGAPFDIQG
jgi:hypothetical protein